MANYKNKVYKPVEAITAGKMVLKEVLTELFFSIREGSEEVYTMIRKQNAFTEDQIKLFDSAIRNMVMNFAPLTFATLHYEDAAILAAVDKVISTMVVEHPDIVRGMFDTK